MIVHRSPFRPAAAAPKTTQFQRDLREALAGAKRRQRPVTLVQLRGMAKTQDSGGHS
ncbi:hypothetical protein ACFQE0_26145 [Methylobacterium komagatae]|uniref:Uncharacterized protein n=1 Tax=Methylobacterium komagatae TaxID=374425 RepID=A0ABW2BT35_9HYPH